MNARSSTSSSEAPAPSSIGHPGPSSRPAACRKRRLPRGLAIAVLLGLIVHLTGVLLVDGPVARPRLRRKVDVLTRDARPCLVMAGDSRVLCSLVPSLVAEQLGLPKSRVINIADFACESSAAWTAYHEFSARFPARAVMLLGVSLFSVNDGADQIVGDELLWDLSFRDRCRLVPISRAITACFLPEKALWAQCTSFWPGGDLSLADDENGFYAPIADKAIAKWSPAQLRDRIDLLRRTWYVRPALDGLRWARLRRDLKSLVDRDVQVVLLDPPCHPALAAGLANTPESQTDQQFHRQFAQLGGQYGVPVLTCRADWFGQADPDRLFIDLVHVNRAGAEVYSRWVAARMKELAHAGLVELDPNATMLAAAADRAPAQDK